LGAQMVWSRPAFTVGQGSTWAWALIPYKQAAAKRLINFFIGAVEDKGCY